jgi:Xaa-Pro aminopeptidase
MASSLGRKKTFTKWCWPRNMPLPHATKAGARFNDPHEAALRVLSQGLLDLGLLTQAKHGSLDDVLESLLPFYMHRTSHWLGMDVHDCGSYVEPGVANSAPAKADPLTGVMVQPRPAGCCTLAWC